ncbi:MAG: hypothetical protein KTR35_12850 [Gammaproteobacteria bacterium]|nr:hypothetical protein [Gammaproteobacteria bacterium]
MKHPRPHQNKQRGTALLVALVMIFMLSIMGISAMRSSTMENRMAANSIQASNAFQAAESSTEIVLNDYANINAALTDQVNGVAMNTTDELDGSTISLDANVTLMYVGDGPAPGFSLGQGGTNFRALRLQTNGTGNINAVAASSEVEQGAFRIAPAVD